MKKFSPHKYRILLDANLSRKLVPTLSKLTGFDFMHISTISEKSIPDSQIVEIAKDGRRIIISHDLDYGEIYYLKERGRIGVIMLRLRDQTSDNVIQRLNSFLRSSECKKSDLSTSLVIIEEEKTRIFSP